MLDIRLYLRCVTVPISTPHARVMVAKMNSVLDGVMLIIFLPYTIWHSICTDYAILSLY